MKKLFLIYIGTIFLIFTIPIVITMLNHKPFVEPLNSSIIPKEITVYFKDVDKVETLNFEEYIKGVVPAEMPALFHVEAIKAQSVAARTYALNKYIKFTKDISIIPPEHKGAIVCTDSKHCSAYYSKEKLLELKGQDWMNMYYKKYSDAIDSTKGEILVYNEEPILAVFHSSSAGGVTQNCKDVWGGDLPYLVSVKSDGEENHNGFETTVEISSDEFKSKLKSKYPNAVFAKDKTSWCKNIKYVSGEYVGTIDVGGITIKGTEMRSIFGLRSTHFKINIEEDNFIFTVQGSGHGIGMSQYGANAMAQNGSKYNEILTWYYMGATLKK